MTILTVNFNNRIPDNSKNYLEIQAYLLNRNSSKFEVALLVNGQSNAIGSTSHISSSKGCNLNIHDNLLSWNNVINRDRSQDKNSVEIKSIDLINNTIMVININGNEHHFEFD